MIRWDRVEVVARRPPHPSGIEVRLDQRRDAAGIAGQARKERVLEDERVVAEDLDMVGEAAVVVYPDRAEAGIRVDLVEFGVESYGRDGVRVLVGEDARTGPVSEEI